MNNNPVVDTTGVSTNLSKNWTNRVFRRLDQGSCCTTTGMATTVSMLNGATVGARLSPPRPHRGTARPANPNIDHLVNVLQRKNLYVFLKRRTIGICICATTEMSTTSTRELCTTLHNGHVKNWSKSGTRGISTIGCTVCTVSARLCLHNRNSQPLSMN